MHTKNIFSTVLLSLASASVILAAPTTSKRAAESEIICPVDCLDGDCAGCPPLPPREEPDEKVSSRNVDAVPGCPFNCNEDGCDLCAPPLPSKSKKEKRDEPLKRNEADLIPVRYVKRKEDLECIPGQPGPPVLVCSGLGCINCPPEGAIGQVKRKEAELLSVRYVKRKEDLECIPGQPGPPVLVCSGLGCINCPPEEETEKVKRAEKVCIPHCVGEHCQCDDEEQVEA